MSNIALYPHSKRAKYTRYRDAWRQLRGDNSRAGSINIVACADEATQSTSPACPSTPGTACRKKRGRGISTIVVCHEASVILNSAVQLATGKGNRHDD